MKEVTLVPGHLKDGRGVKMDKGSKAGRVMVYWKSKLRRNSEAASCRRTCVCGRGACCSLGWGTFLSMSLLSGWPY